MDVVGPWMEIGNCFPHCMFPVTCRIPNMPLVHFPNVCPEQLKPKSAFCVELYPKAQALGYPTTVKGFLSYCGAAPSRGISCITHDWNRGYLIRLLDNTHVGKLLEMNEADEEGSSSDEDEAVTVEGDVEPDKEEAEIDAAYEKLASSCDVVSGSDAVLDSQGISCIMITPNNYVI